jgi:hypothetical protein
MRKRTDVTPAKVAALLKEIGPKWTEIGRRLNCSAGTAERRGKRVIRETAARNLAEYEATERANNSVEWKSITKLTTLNVDAAYNQEYRYDGALQGKLGTWYKDSSYFNLRELSSAELVKCYYRLDMYDQIYRLYEDKDAVVNVSGRVVMDRATGRINEVRLNWAKSYTPLSDSEFNRLFGLAPDLTETAERSAAEPSL